MQKKFQLKIYTGIHLMTAQSLAKVLHKLKFPLKLKENKNKKHLKIEFFKNQYLSSQKSFFDTLKGEIYVFKGGEFKKVSFRALN